LLIKAHGRARTFYMTLEDSKNILNVKEKILESVWNEKAV